MTWYAIVDVNGNLVSTGTVLADPTSLANAGLASVELSGNPAGQVWDTNGRRMISAPSATPAPLTPLAFIQRFTAQEFWALRNSPDPQVQFFLYQMQTARSVDPTDATVQGGLSYLVALGIITQNRAAALGQAGS